MLERTALAVLEHGFLETATVSVPLFALAVAAVTAARALRSDADAEDVGGRWRSAGRWIVDAVWKPRWNAEYVALQRLLVRLMALVAASSCSCAVFNWFQHGDDAGWFQRTTLADGRPQSSFVFIEVSLASSSLHSES